MSTNSRRGGNRSSIPSRGGMRRSNTPPPPSTRLGIDGLPERDPISTSRPRGLDGLPLVPALDKPPSDVVADAKRGAIAPPPVAPVPAEPTPADEPKGGGRTTLHSSPGSVPDDASEPEETAATSPSRAPSATKRKSRAGNKKSGKTVPPPATTSSPPKAAMKADNDSEPAPKLRSDGEREAPRSEAAKVAPLSSPPPSAERAPDAAPFKSSLGGSIPPSAEFDQRFFDHGERAAAEAHAASLHDVSDLDNYDEKLALKHTPEAIAKRALFGRYIMFGIAVIAVLGLYGVYRARATKTADPDDMPVVVTVVPPQPTPSAVPPPPAVAKADPSAAPLASGAAAAPAASGSAVAASDIPPAPSGSAWVTAPAASAPPGGSAAAEVASAAPGGAPGSVTGITLPAAVPGPGAEPTADEKKEAAKDKRSCQSFLDQGAFAKAVEAGEKSVSLDPTDGDAWLLLGAAYQAMGKTAEARRSFSSCVAEGKRGQIGECRSMLR
jgi:tetratricopeptide (TPR) repeat protein